MPRTITKLLIVAAIAVGAFGADNSLGTWKLNMEKSKFTPVPIVKSLTSTREAVEGGVKVTFTGELANGDALNGNYTAKFDGKDNPVTGAPFDTISMRQTNANTITSLAKKTGTPYKSTGRTVISKDGKTMTTTTKGTNEQGKAFHNVMVYDKQ